MRSCTSVLARLVGLYLLGVLMGPAQATLPQEPAASSTQRSPFAEVRRTPLAAPAKMRGPTIVGIEFRGARRVPQSALRALISSRVGSPIDTETLRGDVEALYQSRRFSRVVWETEESRSGPIVHFVVIERPLIQSVEYRGNGAVTTAEILARFEQRKVRLGAGTLCDENELRRAAATVQELLAEKGLRNMTVTPSVEPIWQPSEDQSGPPSTVRVILTSEAK